MHILKPEHIQFLKDLSQNNNREWFKENKSEFDGIYAEIKDFFAAVNAEMLQSDDLDEFHVHRIYRNLRFSKDKTPYKNHFSLYLGRRKPLLRGGYYLNIEPGNSFVGGGFWRPNSDDLLRIRKEIAFDDRELREILVSKEVEQYFGGLTGEELKTAPRDFEKDHPAIDLIRKKQYFLTRRFTDAEVLKPNFFQEAVATFKALRPFFDYMSEVLTTDENGESLYG